MIGPQTWGEGGGGSSVFILQTAAQSACEQIPVWGALLQRLGCDGIHGTSDVQKGICMLLQDLSNFLSECT